MIISNTGTNTKIIGNTLDGSWDHAIRSGIFPVQDGADDGIFVDNEIGDTIQNNKIQNVFDCGIEFGGAIVSSNISGNNISFAGLSGIGGWYYLSMIGDTINQNSVNEAGNLFTIWRSLGLLPAPTPALAQLGVGSSVIFSNNVFSNNTFVTTGVVPAPLNGATAFIPVYDYMGYVFGSPGHNGEVDPKPSQFQISNNTFTNNQFGHVNPGPYFGTNPPVSGMVIDGGGNVCITPNLVTNYPLTCN